MRYLADHNGKRYVPVERPKPNGQPPRNSNLDDSMQLDDTKDRIYIHNLDEELSEIQSDEEKLVFLPDIEKKLSEIPKSVLLGESRPSVKNEMILYGVPTSLSIPKEQDNVRKAIIESRARAREKQINDAERPGSVGDCGYVPAAPAAPVVEFDDAMDLE